MLHAQMDNIDGAFDWLDKVDQDPELEMYWLKVEPLSEILRNDPRWQEMLEKVGFPGLRSVPRQLHKTFVLCNSALLAAILATLHSNQLHKT